MSVFRPSFHTSLANRFVDDVHYSRSNLYYYIGRIEAWEEETMPQPDPSNAYYNDVKIRDNIVYLKKITSNDVSLCTRNHEWRKGEVYAQWDDRKDMTKEPFYVLTKDYNVYKCLNNNNGAPSEFEPSEVNYDVVETPDGYLWKYMFNIPPIKRRKFISTKYIPVQNAITDSFYTRGAVESVEVLREGENYPSKQLTTATVIRDMATVDETEEDSDKTAKVTLIINNNDGSIADVVIDNKGAEYYTDPTIKIIDPRGLGRGKYGSAEAKLEAKVKDGKLDYVAIVDPGTGYSADPSTVLSVTGDGHGCELYPHIVDGRIVSVIVANSGEGYSFANVEATSHYIEGEQKASGAQFRVVIGDSKLVGDQSAVEQSTTSGAIYACVVTNGGSGYTDKLTCSIVGDGEGAIAEAIRGDTQETQDKIVAIRMLRWGKNYTYANIVFEDPGRSKVDETVDAEAYAILPPVGGHGKNAIDELYADTFSVYVNIRDEGGISGIGQEFRQFGLIRNPKELKSFKNFTSSDSVVTFKIRLNKTTDLKVDDILNIEYVDHRIVAINGDVVELQQFSSDYYQISTSSGIVKENDSSGLTNYYEILEVISSPNVNKYSGELLVSSNSTPIEIMSGRTFGVRSYIKL